MRYDAAMRLRLFLGVALLVGAFAAAAAGMVAHRIAGGPGVAMSAHDLWYTLRPGSLVVVEATLERLHPWLWDPLIAYLLAVPAWLLLGVPGLLLVWHSRPRRGETDIDEDALFLFDRLAERARAEGYGNAASDPYVLPPRRLPAADERADDDAGQAEAPRSEQARPKPRST